MTPYNQLVLHDPENNQYGDCQRACIASLLDIAPVQIPHFHESGDPLKFRKSLNGYLATMGLIHITTEPFNFRQGQFRGMANCYHMIYGQTVRGTRHAVVALNGEIIHDPHPSKAGLIEDCDGGVREFAFLAKAFAP